MVTVLLWAAARDAAGTARTTADPGPLAAVLSALVEAHPRLAPLLPRCRFVLDGELVDPDGTEVPPGSTVEVMPPYAGG